MTNTKNVRYISQKGYDDYTAYIEYLKKELADLRMTKGDYDRNSSDSYETGVYDQQENLLLNSIANYQKELSEMVIITNENADESAINMEDVVDVEITRKGETTVEKFRLTGGIPRYSSDVEIPEISINSPLGNAIFGKRVGDTASYEVRGVNFDVKIISKEGAAVEKTPQKQPGGEN